VTSVTDAVAAALLVVVVDLARFADTRRACLRRQQSNSEYSYVYYSYVY
jgi:hypothetical protein